MPLMPSPLFSLPTRRTTLFLSLGGLPTLYYLSSRMSYSSTTTSPPPPPPASPPLSFPTRPYTSPHTTFPYTTSDLTPQDTTPDPSFYSTPRFVTHIDDHAISLLKQYYSTALPSSGRILDLCSSWVSHFPTTLTARGTAAAAAAAAARGDEMKPAADDDDAKGGEAPGGQKEGEQLEILGLGMNEAELAANPILKGRVVQDLNADPHLNLNLPPSSSSSGSGSGTGKRLLLDATVCVVSIDYLTNPLAVLSSVREHTRPGGMVHLVISNRCFPTKCVGRWLRIGERERLEMVGDYLHFSGWEGVEIVELCDGKVREGEEHNQAQGELGRLMGMLGMGMGGGRVDPLWVVRGRKGSL